MLFSSAARCVAVGVCHRYANDGMGLAGARYGCEDIACSCSEGLVGSECDPCVGTCVGSTCCAIVGFDNEVLAVGGCLCQLCVCVADVANLGIEGDCKRVVVALVDGQVEEDRVLVGGKGAAVLNVEVRHIVGLRARDSSPTACEVQTRQGEGCIVLQGCRGTTLDGEPVELGCARDGECGTLFDNDVHVLIDYVCHCLVGGYNFLRVATIEGGVVGGGDGAGAIIDDETIDVTIVGLCCQCDGCGSGGKRKCSTVCRHICSCRNKEVLISCLYLCHDG